MGEQLQTILISAFGTLLMGLISWLTVVITNFLNSKIKDKKLAKLVSDIWDIVSDAVQEIMQTYVDTLKKQGTWNKETATIANEKAKNIIKAKLKPEMISYIEEHFGDVEEYITSQIEVCIYQLKK